MSRIAAGDPAPDPAPDRPTRSRQRPRQGPIPSRAPSVDATSPVFEPPFLGSRVVEGVPIDEIVPFVNETALFRNQWQFRPDPGEGDTAFKQRLRPLMEEQVARAGDDDLLVPQVVYGYYPVGRDGDDLVVWTDETRSTERTRFSFPRQRHDPWLCIADFFRDVDDERCDYAAFHIVTMGERASRRAAALFEKDRYTDYLLLHGLSVEMTEALAEMWHRHVRAEWGFGDEDGPTTGGLFRQQYRGGRFSWGYPACPDLEDNERVAELLDARRIGVTVGAATGYQYQPEQTTSALIAHHPQAKYFVARTAEEVRHADDG
jgi:5-methyltetrahydrofolate--homocysteine methyltransferase